MRYKKGDETRNSILEKAIDIFNNKGILLTINALAREMKLTKSSISNHYPTKETLFQAIMDDYQQTFRNHLAIVLPRLTEPGFKNLTYLINDVMDIQYHYRAGIAYACIITPFQNEAAESIKASYRSDVENIRKILIRMIDKRLLDPKIIEPGNFDIFIFQYTTLLTTWVIPLIIYEHGRGYPAIKPLYLKSILECYKPYITKSGLKDFNAIDFTSFKSLSWKKETRKTG